MYNSDMDIESIKFNDSVLASKFERIKNEIIKVYELLSDDSQSQNLMENGAIISNDYLDKIKPLITDIGNSVGFNDDRFLYLSDMVSLTSMTLIKWTLNHINLIASTSDFRTNDDEIETFKQVNFNIQQLLTKISSMKMTSKVSREFNDLSNRFKTAERRLSHSKKGCYIATMVYKDYNSKEVILFRRYRDEVLLETYLGQYFIKLYYFISPSLVKYFGRNKFLTRILRNILDFIIYKINNRNASL